MEQLSKEWFAARKGRITGSQVGAILGLSPFATPGDVMRRMVREYHGAEPEFTGNPATEWGKNHEQRAILEYQMQTGNIIIDCGFVVHSEHEWLGASPDGLINDYGIIEIKAPYGKRNDSTPVFKTLAEQPHYLAQMLIEMACTNACLGDFFQWTPHGTHKERIWLADHNVKDIINDLQKFYDRYIAERELPSAQKYLDPKRPKIESDIAYLLIEEYDQLCSDISEATEKKAEILQEIVELAGEKDADIFGRKLTRVERKGAVDYGKIPALKGVDLELYRKEGSGYWRLS